MVCKVVQRKTTERLRKEEGREEGLQIVTGVGYPDKENTGIKVIFYQISFSTDLPQRTQL